MLKWDSVHPNKKNNVGKGEQRIINMTDEAIEVELRLITPMPATCSLIHHFIPKDEHSTEYICTFSTEAKFPFNLPAILIGKKFI